MTANFQKKNPVKNISEHICGFRYASAARVVYGMEYITPDKLVTNNVI